MNSARTENDADFQDVTMPISDLHTSGSHLQETSFDSNGDGEPLEEELSEIPIDGADHGSSLPSVEELRHSLPQQKRNCRFCVLTGVGILVLILCLSIGVGVSNKKQKAKSQQFQPRKATLSQVINYIATTGLSSKADLQKGGSPQSMAANWLADLDGLNMALPSDKNGSSAEAYKYLTRYTLGLLWFALDGQMWTNQFGFLSQNDFCFWNSPVPVLSATGIDFFAGGVYCDQTKQNFANLHLGECIRRIAADSKRKRPLLACSLLYSVVCRFRIQQAEGYNTVRTNETHYYETACFGWE
jgi:hypothetical protein